MLPAALPLRFGVRIADLKNDMHYRYTDPQGKSHTFYVDFADQPEDTVSLSPDGQTARISCFVGTRGGMNPFATITTGVKANGHLLNVEEQY